jgi:hypothetical protein
MRSPTQKEEEKGLTQNANSQLGYNTLSSSKNFHSTLFDDFGWLLDSSIVAKKVKNA